MDAIAPRRSGAPRPDTARAIREQAADQAYRRRHPHNMNNGEEAAYPSYIANYTKGLPHDNIGEVRPWAYRALLRALMSGDPADFEVIPLGVLDPPGQRQRCLINPQAGLKFTLEGPDAHALMLPPAPRLDDAQTAADMAELYWMAAWRDVRFADYSAATVGDAVASLTNEFTGYRGPAPLTPQTLFRGSQPGCLAGPFVSQFLLKDVPFGSFRFVQRQQPPESGTDFLTDHPTWLNIQNGAQPNLAIPLECAAGEPVRRHIITLRDLTNVVHFDVSYQHYLNACFILQHMRLPAEQLPAGPCATAVDGPSCMSGPLDLGIAYGPRIPGSTGLDSRAQDGFATFGNWHIPTLLAEVATRALWAMWYQKWFVHRRLRPEELGGLLHIHLAGLPEVNAPDPYPHPEVPAGRYPMLHPEILDSLLGGDLSAHYGPGKRFTGYFLPQAFPEGSPLHPSYGEGHAVVAGACVTVLKAFYAGLYEFDPASPNPFDRPEVPNADGSALVPYVAGAGVAPLTVEGELNKLASNIGLAGRGGAGVHFRSDNTDSLRLGEAVAIALLQEQMRTYNETRPDGSPPFFKVTTFDGPVVTITA